MTLDDFVLVIRQSTMTEDPDTYKDTEYLSLRDEDIKRRVESVIGILGVEYSPDDIPKELTYPLNLLVRRDLYYSLAVKEAPLFSIRGEAGSINRQERFEHYYKLIGLINEEYQSYKNSMEKYGVVMGDPNFNSTFAHGEMLLTKQYYTERNLFYANAPKCELIVDYVNLQDKTIDLTMNLLQANRFLKFSLYEGTYDKYTDTISGSLILETTHIHDKYKRISVLTGLTKLLLVVEEKNGLKGYSQKTVEVI